MKINTVTRISEEALETRLVFQNLLIESLTLLKPRQVPQPINRSIYLFILGFMSLSTLQVISKSKLGFLHPVQQPGSYWDRSSELPLVGLEPTEVTAYD